MININLWNKFFRVFGSVARFSCGDFRFISIQCICSMYAAFAQFQRVTLLTHVSFDPVYECNGIVFVFFFTSLFC